MSEQNSLLSGYLSQEELAREINVTVRTVQRWEAQRLGPPITRVGGRPMYRKESVREWLHSLEAKPAPDRRRRGRAA